MQGWAGRPEELQPNQEKLRSEGMGILTALRCGPSAVVMAPQVGELGAKTQEQVPRPFQGLLSTMESFMKRLMSPEQQEETSAQAGKGPVLLSTLLVSLEPCIQ